MESRLEVELRFDPSRGPVGELLDRFFGKGLELHPELFIGSVGGRSPRCRPGWRRNPIRTVPTIQPDAGGAQPASDQERGDQQAPRIRPPFLQRLAATIGRSTPRSRAQEIASG